jgi:hypothetical protein
MSRRNTTGPVVVNRRVGNTIESILMSDPSGKPLTRGRLRKGLEKVKPNRKDMERSIEAQIIEDEKRIEEQLRKGRSFKEGGMIPPEKKGFNMLPESVQNKIDPGLAAEFMHGGEVHAPSENVSRGTRAAIKGKKFSGVY